ncbi:ABC transporter permease [Frankia sp. Cr1]|uniref:ABC transporter permease n=1 Tax=Frankia sp. Cr1 TaxID=3073931 RepID=UPI002AD387A7|nr:ABC transporter permease [Frankia sp. Cr1]
MFVLTYLGRELRHRSRQATLVAAGLAVGVGLVLTTTAISAAVGDAQNAVLHTLDGVGTDIIVTAKPPADSHGDAGATSGLDAGGASGSGLSVDGGAVMDSSTVDAVAKLAHVDGVADSLVLSEVSPPPAGSDAIPASTRIDGIDVTRLGLGPAAAGTLRSGRFLSQSDARGAVAVVDTQHAASHRLRVGSTIIVVGIPFAVVGIVDQPAGSGAASVYLPLAAARQLPAGRSFPTLAGKVSTIYVSASTAADVSTVETELAALLPSTALTSSRDLAEAVSGSLASATALAHDLGTWLTVGVLLTTVVAASLLTLSSVTRRTRELGTLKAIGWTSQRVITQIMAESGAVGLVGAALGIAIGYAGIGLVNAGTPVLTATVDHGAGTGTGTGSAHSLAIRLNAHTDPGTIAAATLLAITAALLAGTLAAWRTTRLRPAHALAKVE